VIYDPTGEQKMIAFIMPNEKITQDIFHFTVTVDEVEKRTGIDFFSGLEDLLENRLEEELVEWKYPD
jgi:endonuclease G